MSYDIDLIDPVTKEVIIMDKKHNIIGGTYRVGGTNELSFNITWNYSKFFYETIDADLGIRKIYGMTAEESFPIICTAIAKLKGEPSENYWDSTEGNAKSALINLLMIGCLRPDGIWKGD